MHTKIRRTSNERSFKAVASPGSSWTLTPWLAFITHSVHWPRHAPACNHPCLIWDAQWPNSSFITLVRGIIPSESHVYHWILDLYIATVTEKVPLCPSIDSQNPLCCTSYREGSLMSFHWIPKRLYIAQVTEKVPSSPSIDSQNTFILHRLQSRFPKSAMWTDC